MGHSIQFSYFRLRGHQRLVVHIRQIPECCVEGISFIHSSFPAIIYRDPLLLGQVSESGAQSQYAGGGTNPFLGSSSGVVAATSVQLGTPQGLFVSLEGDLYISDYDNFVIRKVSGVCVSHQRFCGLNCALSSSGDERRGDVYIRRKWTIWIQFSTSPSHVRPNAIPNWNHRECGWNDVLHCRQSKRRRPQGARLYLCVVFGTLVTLMSRCTEVSLALMQETINHSTQETEATRKQVCFIDHTSTIPFFEYPSISTASLYGPFGAGLSSGGDLFIADTLNDVIRRVSRINILNFHFLIDFIIAKGGYCGNNYYVLRDRSSWRRWSLSWLRNIHTPESTARCLCLAQWHCLRC